MPLFSTTKSAIGRFHVTSEWLFLHLACASVLRRNYRKKKWHVDSKSLPWLPPPHSCVERHERVSSGSFFAIFNGLILGVVRLLLALDSEGFDSNNLLAFVKPDCSSGAFSHRFNPGDHGVNISHVFYRETLFVCPPRSVFCLSSLADRVVLFLSAGNTSAQDARDLALAARARG